MRVVRARPRLFTALGVGVLVVAVLTVAATQWRPATRVLLGWNVAVVLYLALAAHLMATADVREIRRRAAREDEGQLTILVLTVAAALASLAAIFAQLGSSAGAQGARQPSHVGFAIATIFLSWAFVHTILALHYAHEFYDEMAGGGLAFPEDKEPDYWDFAYFSFVIGMTSQVSDVAVTCKPIRRLVAAHGVISFVFNVALLALTINLAAGAI
ncbi:MAG TPA: DUF1345 domain-containing protein [Methylomirabilota bacterium]|nr:DUF1345 domain-containing protein [Methylomirabilota bacterium]